MLHEFELDDDYERLNTMNSIKPKQQKVYYNNSFNEKGNANANGDDN